MNTSIAYSHEFVKELTAAGMPETQAEIIARQQYEIIDHNLATKQDLELLKKDLIIKLGSLTVGGLVATIGIILGFMSMMLPTT